MSGVSSRLQAGSHVAEFVHLCGCAHHCGSLCFTHVGTRSLCFLFCSFGGLFVFVGGV